MLFNFQKPIITIFFFTVFFMGNTSSAQDNVYETKLTFTQYRKDLMRGRAQITFRKNYKKLLKQNTQEAQKKLENIHQYRQIEMENAFKHSLVSAKMTYRFGAKNTLCCGYKKELNDYDTEIKNFGGKVPAFLDTNCDLWNNQKGVEYALNGRKEHKSLLRVCNEIYDNLTNPDSDFIIDYKNDTRRWNEKATPDNILEILEEKTNELKQK